MPKTLLERCQPDSVREFRLAADERFQDGIALATSDRRTAAIYVWGYATELTLKAAYFNMNHFLPDRVITLQDLQHAVSRGPQFGIHWPGNLHRIDAWARLVAANRTLLPAPSYSQVGFGASVLAHSFTVAKHWRETLRYRKNIAYWHEVKKVWKAAEWLLSHSTQI